MSALAIPKLSVEEYLAIDRAAELKSDYHDGLLFPICAASWVHGRLCAEMARQMTVRLSGGPCGAVVSPVRVRVSQTKYVYPDLLVVCGKPALTDEQADTVTNPKVIVEVLSPSTTDYDYGTKFGLCRELPSFEEYVLVSQDRQRIEVYRRTANQQWLLSRYEGPDAVLPVDSLSLAIPLAEIYAGVL